jgi:hypothetical protein
VEVGEACGRIPLPIKKYGGHKGCDTTIQKLTMRSSGHCMAVEKSAGIRNVRRK